jgi:CYTH domain-containing protein
MSLEIERKFLVANEGWKTAVIRSVRIRDGLIANNKGNKARVRIANDVATIALKSRRRGPVRTEFEYAIPRSDAEEMLRSRFPLFARMGPRSPSSSGRAATE